MKNKMLTEVFKGNLTALSPIHHGDSSDYGTTKLILSLPTVIINPVTQKEEIENIPAIHGNAIRGYLRRLIMDDYLTQLDYELNSKKVYHFLFTGGLLEALDNKDKGAINLSLKKEIRENITPISLLGSALGNQMIQGKLKVGIADIVCSETAHYHLDYESDFQSYNLKAVDFGTRLDDLKEERNDDGQAHQMKYEFETLIRGTRFTHEFVLENCNNIERSCFKRMIDLWNERPYLGGKSSTGYGKIKLDYPDINTLSNKAYLDYLNDNKDKITVFLDDLVGKWK